MNNPHLSLLLDFFRDESFSPASVTEKQWESVIRIAREAGILGRIAQIVRDKEAQDSVPLFARKHLQAATAYSIKQARQVKYEAQALLVLLQRAGIERHMFLKGSAYVLSNSPVSKGRTFSDIDILVDRALIEQAERKLVLYGWFQEETSDYDQRYYRQWTHEIPPLMHSVRGTVLDMHHNLLPPVTGRAPDIERFWREIRTLDDGEQVLSPAAMTLHSIIHLFFQEEFSHGFRDLSDIHLMFTHHGSEDYWATLCDLANDSGFGRELYLAMRYSVRILGSSIPKGAIEQMNQHKPGKGGQIYYDWLFGRVLLPQHSLVDTGATHLANTVGFIRGHFIKMPLHILVYHTFHKAVAGINFILTGRKANSQPQNKEQEQ